MGAGRRKLPLGLRLRDDGSIVGLRALRARSLRRKGDGYRRTRAEMAGDARRATEAPCPDSATGPRKIGHFYSAELTAVGGVSPTVWKLRRGRLPHGIRLVPALGGLTGTPSEAGTHQFTVEVIDGLNVSSSRTFAIVVSTSRQKT